MSNFYVVKDDKVIFTGDGELIYYVPERNFSTNIAISVGEYIQLLGVFSYGLYDKNGKEIKVARFKCPTMIECAPSDMTKEKDFILKGTRTPTDYRLLHFKKGDELICNINVSKEVDNVEKFLNLLVYAHMPEDIPYNEIHEYLIKNAELNGFNYKVSGQLYGLLIGELYRSSKDYSKPFRLAGTDDMLDYKAISIKEVPKYTSPYTAITSENADEAIAAAMTTTGKGNSPLEKVMMG